MGSAVAGTSQFFASAKMRASGGQRSFTSWPRRIRPCDSERIRISCPPQPSEDSVWTMVSGVTYASRVKSSLFAFSSRLAREAASLAGIEEPLRLAARDLPRDRSLAFALIESYGTVIPRARLPGRYPPSDTHSPDTTPE